MKPIDSEKLIAEIERLLKCTEPHSGEAVADGSRQTLYWIKDFITSLQQEQPDLPGIEESGIPGKDYIPVEWVDACEMYGKWKIVKQEQPEADLEKAARYVYESWMGGTMDDVRRDMVELGRVINARKEESK